MLLLLALCWGLRLCAGSLGEARSWDDTSEQVGLRVPRQLRLLQRLKTKPLMTEFSVKSTIISRYAFTAVSCRMLNRASEDQEIEFLMQIPAAAFITNFTMLIGDTVYQGEITEREKKNGDKVKEERNKTTEDNGEKGTETFRASVVIPSKDKAVFLLSYEELLQRRLGKYEHIISVRPQQLVGRLTVEVNILESSGITSLEVLPLHNSRQKGSGKAKDDAGPPPSTVINQNETFAKVIFKPSVVQQARIAQNGVLGDFIIRYDVNREQSIGDIQVLNEYFVHYFAPKDLPPLPKNVVFVLDSSASMVGTKLRQTKDALFTILHDLRPQDHFNIIGFSNRIKVWKDHLVSVTPNNIRDGKVYIHHMSPTGGTDINGALQRGIRLLNDYVANNDIGDRSVSLIIFLTDGKPTVGETHTLKILNNTKEAARGQICIFTIGIGNDVDFKLLEKLSLENCGLTRRVHEEEDAGSQLIGFYDEIRTPLLSDIYIDYPPSIVEQVTRTLFPNYFNGSEIIIAGKLVDKKIDRLHVEVRASNSKFVILKTDVPVGPQKVGNDVIGSARPKGDGEEDSNHLKRLWSYLTVKELLNSWLQNDDEQEKERLRQKAQALAIDSRFLTPFTSMKLKKSTLQTRKLEDSHGMSAATGPETVMQSLQDSNLQPGSTLKKPYNPRIKVSRTSADGDPHFVVDFPLSKLTVCFNIDGQPGDILRLVSDHADSGVTVNGALIGAPAPPNGHKKQRTYFRTITILVNKPERSYLEITPHRVILDGGDRLVLPCNQSMVVGSRGLEVSVSANANVTITIQGTIAFVILIHLYKKPAPYQRDHLGFYISSSKGLSGNCHGLLGQFLNQNARLTEEPAGLSKNTTSPPFPKADEKSETVLKVKGHQVPVVWKQRKIYNGEEQIDCWFARNAAQLLDDFLLEVCLTLPGPFSYEGNISPVNVVEMLKPRFYSESSLGMLQKKQTFPGEGRNSSNPEDSSQQCSVFALEEGLEYSRNILETKRSPIQCGGIIEPSPASLDSKWTPSNVRWTESHPAKWAPCSLMVGGKIGAICLKGTLHSFSYTQAHFQPPTTCSWSSDDVSLVKEDSSGHGKAESEGQEASEHQSMQATNISRQFAENQGRLCPKENILKKKKKAKWNFCVEHLRSDLSNCTLCPGELEKQSLINGTFLLLLDSCFPPFSDFPLHNLPTWAPHNDVWMSLFLKQKNAHHYSFKF